MSRREPPVLPWGAAPPALGTQHSGRGQRVSVRAAGASSLDSHPGAAAAAEEGTAPKREGPHSPSLGRGTGERGSLCCLSQWQTDTGDVHRWEHAGLCCLLQLLSYALSLPSLSDFVPIDLEEWWAKQFLAKI